MPFPKHEIVLCDNFMFGSHKLEPIHRNDHVLVRSLEEPETASKILGDAISPGHGPQTPAPANSSTQITQQASAHQQLRSHFCCCTASPLSRQFPPPLIVAKVRTPQRRVTLHHPTPTQCSLVGARVPPFFLVLFGHIRRTKQREEACGFTHLHHYVPEGTQTLPTVELGGTDRASRASLCAKPVTLDVNTFARSGQKRIVSSLSSASRSCKPRCVIPSCLPASWKSLCFPLRDTHKFPDHASQVLWSSSPKAFSRARGENMAWHLLQHLESHPLHDNDAVDQRFSPYVCVTLCQRARRFGHASCNLHLPTLSGLPSVSSWGVSVSLRTTSFVGPWWS